MAGKQHTPEEKAKLALEAIRGERTINEIVSEHNIHPNMLSKWKREAETGLSLIFQDNSAKERKARKTHEIKLNIDKIYTAHLEYGYRRICWWLNRKAGIGINHKAVLRHMREMGIQAIYPRQNIGRPEPADKIYPYPLKGLTISHPDHVWSTDITYIPAKTDWLYLTAIMDWYSRYVFSWRISDSMEIGFVLEAGHAALRTAAPQIMNSDQGSHFTSPKYTEIFLNAGARISMDHRGRAYDNIFIERLWRSVKYENVYPQEYSCPGDARIGIHRYLEYYNNGRPHQSLGYRTPGEVYFGDA